MAVARGLLTTLGGRYALVIGCEALSRLMDPADRSTCVLFGDGAGAAILELAETPCPLPSRWARGSDVPSMPAARSRAGSAPITMDGKAVFRFAVDALPKCLHTVLDETRPWMIWMGGLPSGQQPHHRPLHQGSARRPVQNFIKTWTATATPVLPAFRLP